MPFDFCQDIRQPVPAEGAARRHRRPPVRAGGGHDLQRPSIFSDCSPGRRLDITVSLVDRDHVRDLQHALLDTLQLVTGTGQHQDEEEIHHFGNNRLRLANAHRLHQHMVETGSLTNCHGLTGCPRHAAKRPRRGAWPDKGVRVTPEFLHPRLVTKNRAAGPVAGWVHCHHRNPVPLAGQHLAERLNEGALADTGNTGDTNPARITGKRQ